MNKNLIANPHIKDLKQFALMMMWAIPLLFTVIFPWIFNSAVVWWSFSATALFGLLYLFLPKAIYPFFRIWMVFATVIGWINTRVILFIVFYGLIFPIGILLRIFGKLHYRAKPAKNQNSFWIDSNYASNENDLERPF